MSQRILITGGNGQLGRGFAAIWPEATILNRAQLDFTGSAEQIIATIKHYKPEVVINCGAYTAVDQADAEPDLAMQVNGTAVEAMVAACKELDAWFIQLSTDYVLNPNHPAGATNRQADETPAPANMYGRSKLKGETAALSYEHGRVIRTSWVFGDGKNFVQTMHTLGQTKDELTVVSDQIGRPTYAPDLAVAIKALVDANKLEALPPVLHIQNDGPEVSWAGLARAIMADMGSKTRITDVSTAEFAASKDHFAARPRLSVFDLAPLTHLGVSMPDWRDSLKAYLADLGSKNVQSKSV